MIAHVYPVLRLPRRFDVFDYAIPDGLSVSVGDLVTIPFRGKRVLGVVQRVVKTSAIKRLSKVESVVTKRCYRVSDLERIKKIASAIITTPSQLYYFLLHDFSPIEPKGTVHSSAKLRLTLNKNDAEVITKSLKDRAVDFAQLSLEGQIALAHQASKLGRTLIIAPNPRLADRVSAILGIPCLTSKTPRAKKRETMSRWFRDEIHSLVTTRLGTLLPARTTKFAIVLNSTSDDYEYLERNPRFLAPLSASLLRSQGVRVIETDAFPSLLSSTPVLQSPPRVKIIPLKEVGEKTAHPLLSEAVLEQTKEALQSGKSVLYFLNRNQEMDAEKSSTTVLSTLKTLFGKTIVGEINEKKQETTKPLVLATDSFFRTAYEPFEKQTDLVVDLFPDLALQNTDIGGTENRARRLYQIISFARAQNAPCLVQSYQPSYYLSMLETTTFLSDLRETRLRYKMAPFSRTYTITQPDGSSTVVTTTEETDLEERKSLYTLDDAIIIESNLPTYDTPTRSP